MKRLLIILVLVLFCGSAGAANVATLAAETTEGNTPLHSWLSAHYTGVAMATAHWDWTDDGVWDATVAFSGTAYDENCEHWFSTAQSATCEFEVLNAATTPLASGTVTINVYTPTPTSTTADTSTPTPTRTPTATRTAGGIETTITTVDMGDERVYQMVDMYWVSDATGDAAGTATGPFTGKVERVVFRNQIVPEKTPQTYAVTVIDDESVDILEAQAAAIVAAHATRTTFGPESAVTLDTTLIDTALDLAVTSADAGQWGHVIIYIKE